MIPMWLGIANRAVVSREQQGGVWAYKSITGFDVRWSL